MKTESYIVTCLFVLASMMLFAQSNMTIQPGGAVTVYGNLIITSIWSCGQPVIDTRDTKTYTTVQIGTQCWMAQSLNIGTRISGSSNQTNNSIIEKYCYNNDENNCNIYGGLYQWDEAMQYSTTQGVQGICPSGWHLPTDAEWTTLITYLGGESVAGGKMKEAGLTHWKSPNADATNSSGFTAIPAAYRYSNGLFYNLTVYNYFWSTLEYSSSKSFNYGLHYTHGEIHQNDYDKTYGFSARCLKN